MLNEVGFNFITANSLYKQTDTATLLLFTRITTPLYGSEEEMT